jgi:hypothetical protein
LNEETSEFIVEAIDQVDEFSLAVETFRPVETSFCTLPMPELIDFRVCRATRALVLVRMLDIAYFLQSYGAFDAALSWMIPRMRNR